MHLFVNLIYLHQEDNCEGLRMSCKGTRVTQKEKKKMWELYTAMGSYKAVGKKMRRSPETVARYVREYEIAFGVASYMIDR